jgi:hypothetical protein
MKSVHLLVLLIAIVHADSDNTLATTPIESDTPLTTEAFVTAEKVTLPKCDRKRSRLARAILAEEFYPAVLRLNFTLPDSCPLSPNNDIYADNEMVSLC